MFIRLVCVVIFTIYTSSLVSVAQPKKPEKPIILDPKDVLRVQPTTGDKESRDTARGELREKYHAATVRYSGYIDTVIGSLEGTTFPVVFEDKDTKAQVMVILADVKVQQQFVQVIKTGKRIQVTVEGDCVIPGSIWPIDIVKAKVTSSKIVPLPK